MTAVSPLKVNTTVAEPALSIVLTPDNPANSSLVDRESGKVLYTVASRLEGSNRITDVKHASGELIATYTRHDLVADTVHFASGKEESFTNWIKKSMNPLTDNLYWTHNDVKYKWKGNASNKSLELFHDDKAAGTAPLLAFAKSWADPRTTPRTEHPAVLQLAAEAAAPGVRDDAVVAFLFLEARRRAKELGSDAFATAMNTSVNAAYHPGA